MAVSTSHNTAPVAAAYARRCPSTDPENATPGIALTAADCAGLQRGLSPQGGGGVYQMRSPVSTRSANMPPPRRGSAAVAIVLGSVIRPMSDSATYAVVRSAAEPHCTPPIVPPSPTLTCQSTLPSASGSSPCTIPDFCPATSTRRPVGSVTRIGDELKSKSGPFDSAQLVLSGRRQATIHASAAVI